MPTTVEFADLGAGIGNATAVVRNNAAAAGFGAPVPSRPGWTVRDLVADLGRAHRSATAALLGEVPAVAPNPPSGVDPLDWLDDGLVGLLNALAPVHPGPETASAGTRYDWARRQCHDTTASAIDAMAARLGREPRAEELWLSPALARDGIDEVLFGQFGEPRSRAQPEPTVQHPSPTKRLVVLTDDRLGAWTMTSGPDGWRASRGGTADQDSVLTGSARGLFAGLRNRGQEFSATGDAGLLVRFFTRLREPRTAH